MSNIYENDKYKLTIGYDEYLDNPIEEMDLGEIITCHARYELGHTNFNNMSDFDDYIESLDDGVYLSLYLYDHSGLSLSVSSFNCAWDSGQVGYIYISLKDIIKEYGDASKDTIEKVKGYLISEVETIDNYLKGNILYYTLEEKTKCCTCGKYDLDIIDSLGGIDGRFLKETLKEYLTSEAIELFNKVDTDYMWS